MTRQLTQILLLAFAMTASLSGWTQTSAPATATATATDVKFDNAGAVLSGTVLVPENVWAAVVLVQGSGQTERMTGLARWLAGRGVASLTYDKRGVGRSGGMYAGPEVGTNNVDPANLKLLAGDAAAAVTELARHFSKQRVQIGLIGFSQGGWIVPLAALRSPEVRFIILWSGPVVTTREQLRYQFFTNQQDDFWEHHNEAEVREHVRSDPDRFQFTDTDPVDALKSLSVPGLWLFGGRDLNVPVKLSIERLRAITAMGKPFEYQLFPDLGHQLSDSVALPAIVAWLRKETAASSGAIDPGKQ